MTTTTHIPRRSGVGARQVTPPAKPKTKRRRYRGAPRPVCGDVYRPDVLDQDGAVVVHAIVCTADAGMDLLTGQTIVHRGQHRARVARGVLIRWADER